MTRTGFAIAAMVVGLLTAGRPASAAPTLFKARIPSPTSQPIEIVQGADGNMGFTAASAASRRQARSRCSAHPAARSNRWPKAQAIPC
jgi:hypothetical protein